MPINTELEEQFDAAVKEKNFDEARKLIDRIIDSSNAEDLDRVKKIISNYHHEIAAPIEISEKMTEVQFAAKYGTAKSLAFLVDNNKDFWSTSFVIHDRNNFFGVDAFLLGVISDIDALKKAEIMLERGADPDSSISGKRTFTYLLKQGNIPLVKLFIENNVSLESKGDEKPSLYYAATAAENNQDLIELLRSKGVKIETEKQFTWYEGPLITAAEGKNFKAINLLLKNGANLIGPIEKFYDYMKANVDNATEDFLNFFPGWDREVFEFAQGLVHLGGLGLHYLEKSIQLPKLYNYFYPDNIENEKRLRAFTRFPCLFSLITFTKDGFELPEKIAKAIDNDRHLAEELQSYFELDDELAKKLLEKLPPPYSETVSTKELIDLVKNGCIRVDDLPWYQKRDELQGREIEFLCFRRNNERKTDREVKEKQFDLISVVEICKKLTSTLFWNRNNSEFFQEIFFGLVKNCAKKDKKKGTTLWGSIMNEHKPF